MNRFATRVVTAAALALAVATIGAAPSGAAPVPTCSGAFCVTFDLATNDALAPTQATTAAGQPTNLQLRFSDTSAALATDASTWLAKVSAQLGSASTKAFAVTDPATLPFGARVAGTAATAGTCAPGAGGAGYATSCPAGYGTGDAELTGLGSPEHHTFAFGIKDATTGVGGALTANLSLYFSDLTVPGPYNASVPLTVSPATATAGPTVTADVRLTFVPTLYTSGVESLNDVHLNLNGLVTEAITGAVSPPVPFVRQSVLCTSITTTLAANARGTAVASAPFAQTVTGCPNPPALVSVQPVDGNPQAFTFTMQPPAAAVAGRSATLEWVFGDGAKATTGASTTHTYAAASPVVALVTTVDSAGARSASLQLRIGTVALRAKQKTGNLLTGMVADADTGTGVPGQPVLAYRCSGRNTPVTDCRQVGSSTTRPNGHFRLGIDHVTKPGFVVVYQPGTGTTSATQPARFGSRRVVPVLPQPLVTLHVSDKHVRPGTRVTLSGKVSPGKKGKTVRLQGFVRGKWRSIAKTTISQQGTYATPYVVRVPGQDTLKVRAAVDGTARTLAATSTVKRIHIDH